MVSIPIVLLIFISSNTPRDNVDLGLTQQQTEKTIIDRKEILSGVQRQVNDLSVSGIKFPNENLIKISEEKKIIREKVIPEEKDFKNQTPVPLYSLVKNECGEGYALDENGVCQKVITVRTGKTFDSERRRRKRSFPEMFTQRKWRNSAIRDLKIMKNLESNKRLAGDGFGKIALECSKLYPGLVSDGAGGCTKTVEILDESSDRVQLS